ncbi:hypothetical protein OHA11_36260 [Streptomyces sp. NBC_00878]|nr:hypothetical protein [Streptomyces sp. NBC_00878]
MTRSIIKAAAWTLGPETRESVPAGVYSAECLTCGAQAQPTNNERLPIEIWALKHTGLNPDHRRFKATAQTFWHVTPAENNPYHEKGPQSAQAPR